MKSLKYKFCCVVCKKVKNSQQPNGKMCSPECRKSFYKKTGLLNISSQSVGSVSEMQVCCEMLKRGYSVFRTVSGSSFCDVVAIKDLEVLLLEVRTGYKDMNGKLAFTKILHNKIAMPSHYAVYIVETNEIFIQKITDQDIKNYSLYKKNEA